MESARPRLLPAGVNLVSVFDPTLHPPQPQQAVPDDEPESEEEDVRNVRMHLRFQVVGYVGAHDEEEEQPHRQPDLPDFPTPRSASTNAVAMALPLEEFEVASDDLDASAGSNDVPFNLHNLNDTDLNEVIDNQINYIFCEVPSSDGCVRFRYFVNNNTKVRDLLEDLDDASGGNILKDRVLVYLTGSQLEPYDTIRTYCEIGQTLVLRPRVKGGGVKKGYLKKEEALPWLKQKATKDIVKTVVSSNIEMSEDFNNFVGDFNNSVNGVKLMRSNGVRVVETGLRQVPDEDLTQIRSIMSYGSRNGSTESRLPKLIEILFPVVKKIEHASTTLCRLQETTTSEMVAIYCEEYHDYRDGRINFANENFLKAVDGEIVRRDTLRRANAPIQDADDQARQCIIS